MFYHSRFIFQLGTFRRAFFSSSFCLSFVKLIPFYILSLIKDVLESFLFLFFLALFVTLLSFLTFFYLKNFKVTLSI